MFKEETIWLSCLPLDGCCTFPTLQEALIQQCASKEGFCACLLKRQVRICKKFNPVTLELIHSTLTFPHNSSKSILSSNWYLIFQTVISCAMLVKKDWDVMSYPAVKQTP